MFGHNRTTRLTFGRPRVRHTGPATPSTRACGRCRAHDLRALLLCNRICATGSPKGSYAQIPTTPRFDEAERITSSVWCLNNPAACGFSAFRRVLVKSKCVVYDVIA